MGEKAAIAAREKKRPQGGKYFRKSNFLTKSRQKDLVGRGAFQVQGKGGGGNEKEKGRTPRRDVSVRKKKVSIEGKKKHGHCPFLEKRTRRTEQ